MKHAWLAAPIVVVWAIVIVVVISLQRWVIPWLVAGVVVCAVAAVVLDALGVGRAVAERERAMRDQDGPR